MIFRYPSYYEKFHCIADQCEDTCCAGWEIDIDDQSYEYYQQVPGEFGEKLRSLIQEYESEDVYESHGFRLKENRRCPLLDDNNLCELYRELGESALCEVCTDTPRNYLEYGGERELSLSASCPEAARLIYHEEEKAVFIEKEIDEELDFEEDEEISQFARELREERKKVIDLLQNREKTVAERAQEFLKSAVKMQEQIGGSGLDIPEVTMRDYEVFLRRVLSFTQLESVSEEWEEYLKNLNSTFVEKPDGELIYQHALMNLECEIREQGREYEWEHLLVYYAFLCLPRCIDDYDYLGQAKLVITSWLFLRDLAAATLEQKGEFTKEEWLRAVRIYAKEIEHSQENMDMLAEDFIFEEAYSISHLLQCFDRK